MEQGVLEVRAQNLTSGPPGFFSKFSLCFLFDGNISVVNILYQVREKQTSQFPLALLCSREKNFV